MRIVGDGTRALNFFIDTLIIFGLAFAGFRTWNWYVLYWGYQPYHFGWFFFSGMFLYYTLFETFFARTPGKWFTYSKVVVKTGKRPRIGQIILRSLVRLTIIDMFFIPFLQKPLHDYLSHTEVVEA